ncbi:iron ABC transporter permease [Roseomonas sp. 18066]|uniref:ABC transporter permease n=1 Tax=Roseomonas sp. 18066 TaxID=2681412 RepID=UPI00135A7CB8|nr:ABC transporter permease subunit [Roseomonas sp. 18066]
MSASNTRLPPLAWAALLWLAAIGLAPALRLLAEAPGAALPALAADPTIWRAAGRSLFVAGSAALLAGTLGALQAWLLLLHAVPARPFLLFGCALPLLVPPQIMALGFSQLGGPSSSLLLALGMAPPLGTPNPLHGPGGMILLLGIQGAPLVLLALSGLARRLPGDLLSAAGSLGAGPAATLRRVVGPLLLPGLLAGMGLAFVAALGNFGIAALLGIPGRYPLLTLLIWQKLSSIGPAALAEVAALSLLLAALALPGLWLQFAAARAGAWGGSNGRAFRPLPANPATRAALPVLGLYLLAVLALPLAALLCTALAPATGVPLTPANATLRHFAASLAPGAQTLSALGHSLLLAGGAALLLALAALPIALQQGRRAVRWATIGVDLPYALPGACTAVSVILLVLGLPGGGAVYGTLGLILFAYLARFQALALRPVAAAAARLDPALDRAAQSLGAGGLRRLWRVQLPLLAPALGAGGLLVLLMAVNEVTVSALLHGPGSQTLGVLVFNLQDAGQGPQAAATSCLALLVTAGLMVLATAFAKKLPPGTLPWRP